MKLKALVVSVGPDVVVVNAGLKSEGVIPTAQFYNERGELQVKAGDLVEVALDDVEDGGDVAFEVVAVHDGDGADARRQLRAILYDHLYVRPTPEPDYTKLSQDELEWLRQYYRRNRDHAFGVGKLKLHLWIPERGSDE